MRDAAERSERRELGIITVDDVRRCERDIHDEHHQAEQPSTIDESSAQSVDHDRTRP